MKGLAPVLLALAAGFFLAWAFKPVPSEAVQRAELAEDSIAVLEPLVDSLFTEASRQDTVLVLRTDTLTRTIERIRVEAVSIADSVLAHVDSVGAAHLALLQDLHADEVEALEELADERLAWGETWRETALAQQLQIEQLEVRGDEWQRAFNAQRRQSWWLRGGTVVLAGLLTYSLVR